MHVPLPLRLTCAMLCCGAVLATEAQDVGSALLLKDVWRAARDGRLNGLEPISRVSDKLAAEYILAVASDQHVFFDVREHMAAMVAAWPYRSGHEYLVNQLREHPDCPWTTLHFYTSLGIPPLEPVFRSMLESQKNVPLDQIEHPSRLAAVIRAFDRYTEQDDELVELITRYLSQKAPHVLRVSAATTLGSLRNATSIPMLIPHVADGIIGRDIIGALYRLTGQDLGKNADAWMAWHRNGGESEPLKMLSREQLIEHRATAPHVDPPEETFYGLPVRGKHILFMLDVSESMKGEKLDRLRGEGASLLSSLQFRPRELRYDIITFAEKIQSCSGGTGLMPNDDATFNKAHAFVDRLETKFHTRMNAAFEHLATKVLPDNNVDTIYLLTDGAPTDGYFNYIFDKAKGLHYRTLDITNRVRMIHYWYQVRINTIFIKQRPVPEPLQLLSMVQTPQRAPHPQHIPPAVLMRKFAELSSGQFVQPD
jgi:hypothetical protein